LKIGWVLDYMAAGCWIFREIQPDVKFGMVAGVVMVKRTGLTFMRPLDDFGGFRTTEMVANDWAYECPGHRWEYSANGEWRGCPICEAEENGDHVVAAWRSQFRALPARGVTTHPDPALCCSDYPACDCASVRAVWPGGRAPVVGVGWWCLCGCHHSLEEPGCPLCLDPRIRPGYPIMLAMNRMSAQQRRDMVAAINAVQFGHPIVVVSDAPGGQIRYRHDLSDHSVRWLSESRGWSDIHLPPGWRCGCGVQRDGHDDCCLICGWRRR